MGTRASRLQEDPVAAAGPPSSSSATAAFGKDGAKRESYRRPRCARPTSLVVEFSGSFEDAEANRSRSEEGSDSDTGPQASADGSPEDRRSLPSSGGGGPATAAAVSPSSSSSSSSSPAAAGDTGDVRRPGGGGGEGGGNTSPEEALGNAERRPGEETGRMAHRTFSERLPGNRYSSSGRGVATRSARVRGIHQRPMSEAWIGLYRVNSRHGNIRCPFCTKPFPGGRIEDHLLSCLTSPPLPYNTDVLSKDSGECSICLEELVQGETIARLACLCVYHKSCIDSWSKVKPCCPEHPFD
ncbi:unnamed protein product [Merluccius merluccius]